MRTGLGMNWLRYGSVDELGVNVTYAGDFYPFRPVVTSFELDVGTIGSANRFHGRATVGAIWEGIELSAGFDYESIDSVGLPSWVIGLRVWF